MCGVSYNENVDPLFGEKRDLLLTRLMEMKLRAAKEMDQPANSLLSNTAVENLLRVRPTT
jgi:ribonuclease D